MSRRLRRSFVLTTTVFALLLGGSSAAAPISLAANPTNMKVASIDFDTTTIPELQELMDARKLTSVKLTQFYLNRIEQAEPDPQRRHHRQPDGPRQRQGSGQGAP